MSVVTISQRLSRTRRVLRLSAIVRAAGVAAVGGAIALTVAALAGAQPLLARALGLAVAGALAWLDFVRRGARRLSAERSALWVEERVPRMRYALVSAAEQSTPDVGLERAIDVVGWSAAERDVLNASLRRGMALVVAGAAIWLISDRVAPRGGLLAGRNAGRLASASSLQLQVLARVSPPAYSGLKEQTLTDPADIRALAGSSLVIEASDSNLRATIGDSSLSTSSSTHGRRVSTRVMAGARALTLSSPRGNRIIALEGTPDSVPTAALMLPARDTVFRAPVGAVTLAARVADDYGLATGAFEYIISSGEGESFTFRSGTVGARSLGGARSSELRGQLSLAALQLKPGDILHLRAVAHDANDVTGPGMGSSETRTLRIARAGEYDSLAVEGAAPPEEDKSVLSQRMLINLTETLRKKRGSMRRPEYVTESSKLARDQGRLRRQVGDIVFDRLGDNPSGEHSHDVDESRSLTKEELLKAAEEATKADSEVLDFANGESPVTNINRPLLEAYNAMWDAGRALGVAELDQALPHMYRALAAIQRARTAERLYLRGRAPRVVVDIARVRLQGKERGASSLRSPRASEDSVALSDRRRFGRAVQELGLTAAAAVDSLVLLRVDVLARNVAAARALDAAVEALRAGRDATDALLRARRALSGDVMSADSLSRWSRGPVGANR